MNNAKDNLIALGKAAIDTIGNVVPIIGFTKSFYENFNSIQAERKQNRVNEFVIDLAKDLKDFEGEVQSEYVSHEDFLDVFEKVSRYIANERYKEKRVLFKNIMYHSLTEKGCNYDKTEKYCRLLENLDALDLEILAILNNPIQYNKDRGMIIPDPVHNAYMSSWNETTGGAVLTSLLNRKDVEVRDNITYLFYNGLILENVMDRRLQSNGNPIHVLDNLLTIKGREFIRFLSL